MDLNFSKIEEKILESWKENKIFEKSIKQRARARNFIFYEGPPTANGKPGIHHVLARSYKDIICRYKTMQGFLVLRKAGWDTHGLPVELETEKKLGLKNKKDIEKYGIAQFNKKCKESVWQYKDEWERLTERIGYWLDMKNPYITYENNYIESLWWIIKQIYQKGLLYKDYKVVPYCPRCGTSLSSHEVALGYKKVKEPSIYIKLKILDSRFQIPDSYFLAWTTTPWTLPGNVALAVNPELVYVKAKIDKEIFILAKERLNVLGKNCQTLKEIKGKDLLGLRYKPLFNIPQLNSSRSHRVYAADFVTAKEGTGVVHTAVMYGEDDYNLGKKVGLPTFHTVTEEGKFIKDLGEELANLYVKSQQAESLIFGYLRKNNFLFAQEPYEHDYPFCWRCDSPLLYYAKENWFINMQKIKKSLIANNQKINWVPSHLKKGRFGEWLKEVKDWAFSRERYWGTPLPIWRCAKCSRQEVIGGKKDLINQKFSSNQYYLIRHGDSLKNHKKIACCWPEKILCPLTKKGEKQIKKIARAFRNKKIDIIFSSDLLRAKQTAEILAKETGAEIKFDPRIREIDVGIYNGRLLSDVIKVWGSPLERFNKKLPQGETHDDTRTRTYDFLKDINERHQNKNIVIISHEGPISLLEGTVNGWSREEIVEYRGSKKIIKTGEWRKLNFASLPYNEKMDLDFHRPYIDEVKFRCQRCSGLMERVLELIDVWFDSGSMPFASASAKASADKQNKKIKPPEPFPADYISEAIDQTRGWFYTLLAVSTLLGLKTPYKNVISLGHVLDEKGEKMSKSKGNVVDPWYIIEKYGADAARWYFYTVNQPGDAKLFSERDIEQTLKKFILIYWNSYQFYKTYKGKSKIPAFVPFRGTTSGKQNPKSKNILNRWIISRLNELIKQVTEKLNQYDVTGAARAIEDFVINDLSLWYIRRSRKHFEEIFFTLAFVLQTLAKLTAPFIPFLAEEINQERKSIHLQDWPKADKKLIDKRLEGKMENVREIVASALAERAKAEIRVRQPLNKLQITNYKLRKEKALLSLIQEEVNVKKIIFGKKLELDTKITKVLKQEGEKREIFRIVKDGRKKLGLSPGFIINYISSTARIVPLYMNEKEFKKEMGARKFKEVEKKSELVGSDITMGIELDGKKHHIGIKKN